MSGPLSQPLVQAARELAERAHATQKRKVGELPYFVHLDAVARTLAEHGHHDEIQLAAAYLHDLLEDQPHHTAELHARFPVEVVETVAALTEVKCDADGRRRDKRERFAGYLARLRRADEAARRALPISCADKIDNVRSIVDAQRARIGLLTLLRTRPGEHLPQLSALRELYALCASDALLAAFDRAVADLAATLEAWLPGRAVAIAAEAHLGQFDKAGAPYIEHPLRLMLRATTAQEKMVAVLHDVVEDSRWTLDELRREGFSAEVVRAIDHLTRRPDETYEAFVDRVARDRLATRVKILDLLDNADLSRIPEPTERDHERAATYARALARLRDELERRSLYVRLDPPSVEAVRKLAIHPERRGDHVTLAHRVRPETFEPRWIPGAAVGERVAIRATGMAVDPRVQALVVEIGGTSVRPFDGGILHVTVSVADGERAATANEVLAANPSLLPIDLALGGEVAWVDR